MIIKGLTSAVDIALGPDTVTDSGLVSVINTNASATLIASGAMTVMISAGERVVIEKKPGDTIDAPQAASGVWATGVAYKA